MLVWPSGEYCAAIIRPTNVTPPKKESQPAEGACTPSRYVRSEPVAQRYEDYERSQGVRDESGRRQRAPEETGRGTPTTSCPPVVNLCAVK